MSRKTTQQVSFLMGISFFALSLIVLFTIFPPAIQESPPWGKTLVGSMFALVCILGMTAVFFPTECSRAIGHGRVKSAATRILETKGGDIGVSYLAGVRLVHGHHPPCHLFDGHEFHLSGRTFCAGCIGLLIGAIAVLIGTVVYFFTGLPIDRSAHPLFIAPGILGVLLALLQFHVINVQHAAARLLINAFFVVATFLILVGVDLLLHSLTLDLLAVSFSVFWLYTRISLSNWDHERICSSCSVSCEFRP